MRRSVRAVSGGRSQWHGLQDFAQTEEATQAFRRTRAIDTQITNAIKDVEDVKLPVIDWSHWESSITHTDLVHNLKSFYDEQMRVLDNVLEENHAEKVQSQTDGWNIFEDAVESCKKSVEKSEEIVQNGGRALWVSYNNPPVSQVSTSEWLDVDQYWQAFVEKHHHYHNHLYSAVEDPESKEYDQKQDQDLIKRWEKFDGRGVDRFSNKNLGQRPSYEYYDLYRGPLVEHMIYYLTKTGGDARFFPELIPHQWFCSIYDIRFDLYAQLQKRRRAKQLNELSRECPLDYHPPDLDHDGAEYYARLIQDQNKLVENMTARLMGNFILFSEHVPLQTSAALSRTLGQAGTYYTLGSDVNALFFMPSEGYKTADPVDSFNSLSGHLVSTGSVLPVGYLQTLNSFCNVLQTRKEGLGGAWFNLEGESPREAFMRRLKKDDPAYQIYEDYSREFVERWENAQEISKDEASNLIIDVERRYKLEAQEFDELFLKKDEENAAPLHLASSLTGPLTDDTFKVSKDSTRNADEGVDAAKSAN